MKRQQPTFTVEVIFTSRRVLENVSAPNARRALAAGEAIVKRNYRNVGLVKAMKAEPSSRKGARADAV
ncbi:hypothetical protein EBL87_20740 [Cereibacter sphaeroides]|uniref:hypothetical protein n=1 Tax=Cereibacter sphaeroides TaxID=1063 RepID=UPI000F539390|nr:hypothetical protein [Cereibacter sphaeroides]AZB66134.1 hypothetical protein EBL87_20740 [Cereibacter sphaeroides]AZB70953.1 hypothetical protein EBL86_21700 [Cereibacter sphaeroides]